MNHDSPTGKDKAILFERRLGFTRENYRDLSVQIETKIWQVEIEHHSTDGYGKRYTADMLIQGTEGKQATIRTGWLVPIGTRVAHLVTLWVRKG